MLFIGFISQITAAVAGLVKWQTSKIRLPKKPPRTVITPLQGKKMSYLTTSFQRGLQFLMEGRDQIWDIVGLWHDTQTGGKDMIYCICKTLNIWRQVSLHLRNPWALYRKFGYIKHFVISKNSQRLLLDWIGNQPTLCSFMPWSEAVEQLQTQVQQVGYPLE